MKAGETTGHLQVGTGDGGRPRTILAWLDNLALSLAKDVEGHPKLSLAVFSFLFLVPTVFAAIVRPFWYDELLTFYAASIADFDTRSRALSEVPDFNPPLFYVLTNLCLTLAGNVELGARLPAVIGFLLLVVCTSWIVARRCGYTVGLAAACLPIASAAYGYAYEARPYGLVLGLAALAVLSWQSINDGRTPAIIQRWTLFLAIASAVLLHAYAVVLVVPFGLGEAVRTWKSKRADWATWLAITCPLLMVFTYYLPIMANLGRQALDNSIYRPEVASIPRFYLFLIEPSVLPLIMVLLVVLLGSRLRPIAFRAKTSTIQVSEIAVAVGFVLIPAVEVVIGLLGTRMFMNRYGLYAIIGLAMLLGFALSRFAGGRPMLCLATALILGISRLMSLVGWPGTASAHSRLKPLNLSAVEGSMPVVISDGLRFLAMDYYSDAKTSRRLVFLTDPSRAIHYTGSDVLDHSYPILKRWYPIRGQIANYKEYLEAGRPFLVFAADGSSLDWLLSGLVASRADIRLVELFADGRLFLVGPAVGPGGEAADTLQAPRQTSPHPSGKLH